ncbi:hypothetical protein BDA96_03G187500 [Sorghum bicolor]|uniref:Uncharacterized protein n=2 Tax=Sorghum bicolor TaxID=4558 RepID=A0A921RD91_SORBI|nr:hypothetical protein BDA96_03G187500 [Sorghum bicolor]OQU86923.1 hypothetical protein SORBI_3003G173950 [Sorghum bicolor]
MWNQDAALTSVGTYRGSRHLQSVEPATDRLWRDPIQHLALVPSSQFNSGDQLGVYVAMNKLLR